MAKRRRKVARDPILDQLIGRALLASESVRKEFMERLVDAIVETGWRDEQGVVAAVRTYLAAYNPMLAEHLSNAMILTWLGGYIAQVDKLPTVIKRWMRDHRFWDQLPPEVPGIFGPGAKSPKAVRFPRIEKATESLFKRGLMTRPQYDRLSAAAKQSTFTVAWIDDTAVIGKIRDALAETIAEGPTLDRFREKVVEKLEQSPMSRHHGENVYRTGLMSAYRDGQESLAAHPIVQEIFRFRQFSATHDGRVRDEHLAFEKFGIEGSDIYLSDDPIWDIATPPLGYQCRCVTSLLRISDAARLGLEYAKEWLRIGHQPEPKPYCIDKVSWRPEPGFGVRHGPLLSVGTASSVRMSAQPIRLGDVNPWVPYRGPRGGTGWQHSGTKDVRYVKERPGAHETGGTSKTSVHGVSALPVRGQDKPGGVVQDSQRQAAAAGQALPQAADARVGQDAAGVVPTQRPEAGVVADLMKRTRETGMEHGALFGADGRQIGATVVGRHKDQEGFGYQGVQVTTTADDPDGMTKVHAHPGTERPSKADYLDFFGDTKLSRSMILLGDGSHWEMTRTKETGDIAGHDVKQAWLRAEEDLIIDEGLDPKDEQFTERLFSKLEPMTGVHVEHVKGGSSAASKPHTVAAEHTAVNLPPQTEAALTDLIRQGHFDDKYLNRLVTRGKLTSEQTAEAKRRLDAARAKADEHRQRLIEQQQQDTATQVEVARSLSSRFGTPKSSDRSSAKYWTTPGGVVVRMADHMPIHARSLSHVNVVTGGPSHESYFNPETIVVDVRGKTVEDALRSVDDAIGKWEARLSSPARQHVAETAKKWSNVLAVTDDESEGTQKIYRGFRDDSKFQDASWWTPEKDYAESYGDDIESARLIDDANLLDLTKAPDQDGYISGEALDNIEPGLADVFGMDSDESVEYSRMWDVLGDDTTKLSKFLRDRGYHGMEWFENESNKALLLLHRTQ